MKVIVHRALIAEMMSPAGEVGRATARAAGATRDKAKKKATVDSGLMRNSIIAERIPGSPFSIHYRIGTSVEYAIYQELGTGPIYARRAPLLVFKIGNRWVSTYSTKGVPAVLFLTRALQDLSVEDFKAG